MNVRHLLVLLVLLPAGCRPKPSGTDMRSFAERRRAHPTHLINPGPSPQGWTEDEPPAGVSAVTYPAAPGPLKAWYACPPIPASTRVPAVVFLHGGFAFGAEDWDDAGRFLDAGFAVMAPSLRGENGNPGNHELFFGEVDDARAAVTWLAQQKGIDSSRMFAFGHSAGGVIAALLSLYDEPRLRLTGSAGGLYGEERISQWNNLPFEGSDDSELRLRVLWPHLEVMKVPHLGYVGEEDIGCRFALPHLRKRLAEVKAPLEIIDLPGDHFTSKTPAIDAFVLRIKEAAGKAPARN